MEKKWPGSPLRCDKMSSIVVLVVAEGVERTKSSRMMEETGVDQEIWCGVDWLSSIAKDIAAAVKALVVLQVVKRELVVMGVEGKEA